MRMRGRWGALLAGVALGALVTGALALWSRPAGLPERAREFVDALATGRLQAAAGSMEEDFRLAVTADELRDFLSRSGIPSPAAVTWDGHCVRGGSGKAYAALAGGDGGPVALEVGLESDAGAWRVVSLRAAPAGGPGARFGVPPDADVLALVRRTTGRFAEAVAAGDLTLFLRTTARAFRERFSARQFEQAFRGFVEQQVNLAALERFEQLLDGPPALDEGGVLTLAGHFPTRPSQVRFRYEYRYRHLDWQLIGIDLAVVPAGG